MGPIIDLFLFK
jgi:hypothetical protein